MSEIKVVHLSSVHPPFDVRIFHKECKSLARNGYSVTLVVPHDRDEVVDGVRIKAVPKPGGRLSRATVTVRRVFREAVRQRADVYHFHDSELIPVGLLLQASGKKVVYDVHEDLAGDILHKHWIPQGFRGSCSRLAGLVQQFAARRFSAVATANEELAKQFRQLNRETIVLGNYPLLEEFPPHPIFEISRYQSGTLVSFGGISRSAATEEIVGALSLLSADLNARLILAGGTDSEPLLSAVKEMPGWKRVDYRGRIRRQEMISLLSTAAAAIVIYSPLPNHLGVRSNRLFEALAAGLPVITSNFPRWREFVEENGCGLTVDPSDPRSIASAINYLLSNPKESLAMGHRGRQLIWEKCSWAKEEGKLLGLYDRLLGGEQGRKGSGISPH